MIAPEYFNNHVAVEGEIIVKSVPNEAGFVLVWNPTTKKISRRTHTEIVSDLNLVTSNQLGNYWQKYIVAGYTGIDAPTPFAFLNGGEAQKAYMGGLLVSNAFQDENLIPTNGIYSKGNIATLNYGSAIDWAIAYNWTQTQGATRNWVTDNFVSLNTPQVIPSRKSFGGATGNNYDGNALEVRGNGSTDTIYPGIGFTQPGLYAGTLNYNNDGFNFIDINASDYVHTTAKGYRKSGSSDDYLLTGGGGHKLFNSLPYFPRTNSHNDVIDLNDLTLEGVYYSYQWLNVPISTIAIATVKIYSPDWIRQEYSPIDSLGVTYVRDRYNGTTWGEWKTIANRDWVKDSYVPYTGALANVNLNAKQLNNASTVGVIQGDNSLFGNYVGLYSKSPDGNAIYLGGVASTVGSYIGQARYVTSNQYQSDKSYASLIKFGNDGSTTFYGDTELTPDVNYDPSELAKIDISGITSGGFIKRGYNNGFVLLAGGGHVPISEFATTANLNDYVTLNTNQVIIANKYFSPISAVEFLGTDLNHVNVFRSSGLDKIVSGHEYTHYDTRWRIGNKRGGSSNSLGLGYEFSIDGGITYNEKVLIQPDGNILTSNFGAASDWNAKVDQSQLNDYVSKSVILNDNFDSISGYGKGGFYRAGNDAGGVKYLYAPMLNLPGQDTSSQLQINYNNGSTAGELSYRGGFNGTWGVWRTAWDNVNLPQSTVDYLAYLVNVGAATQGDLLNYITTNTAQDVNAQKTFTKSLRVIGSSVNTNTTKLILGNNSATTHWALSAGENNWSEENFYIGTWNPNTNDFVKKLTIGNDGFLNAVNYVQASGFIKAGSSNAHMLLGDGTDKPISDFATSAQLANYVDLSSEQNVGGVKNFFGAYSRYVLDGDFNTNAFGLIQSNNSRFVVGTFNEKPLTLYYNGGVKVWIDSNLTTFTDNIAIPNAIQNNHALTLGQMYDYTATNYIPKSGGTLTGGGKIDPFGSITFQQTDVGGNATGIWWDKIDDSDKISGIGTLTTNGALEYMYMGWGSTPWSGTNAFVVNENFIGYKNNTIWHEGNFNPNTKVNALDNARAIGFSSGQLPTNNGVEYPYMYFDNGSTTAYIPIATQGFVHDNFHRIDFTGGITNGSDGRSNKSFFDYSWAGKGYSGSVINFSGLNDSYSTELFAQYNNGGNNIGIRSRNGDAGVWNDTKWLFHTGNFSPDSKVSKSGDTMTGALLIGNNNIGKQRVLHLAEPTYLDSYGFNFYTDTSTGSLTLHGLNNGLSNAAPILSANRANNFVGINKENPTTELDVNGNIISNSFIKNNSSDDHFLMGGGGQLTKYSKEDAFVNSGRDFADGTLITTNIDYSHSEGDSFLLEIKGNMYGGGIPMDTKVQGYIYADTIINQSGYSTYSDLTTIIAVNINGNLCFWFPRLWYWQGFSVKAITTGGGGQTTVNRVVSIDNSAEPVGTKQVKIAIYTLSTQNWVNNQGFLTSANLNGYVTQSSLNSQLSSYATLNGVQTFANTNTFLQSPVIPNGTIGVHAVNLNQLLDVAPPYYWNYVGQPAIANRRVLSEMTWNNYGNGHTIFDISSGTTPWGASKSNVDAEFQWNPSYPTLVGGNGSGTYGVRVDSARNADNLGGIPAGNYATQTWVDSNFISKSHPVNNITQANINSWNAGTGGGSSHTHFNLSYLNNIDQYLGTGQAPQFSSVRLMNSIGYGTLALEEDYIGGEAGLVDLSNEVFYAGRINEYIKYGSSVNGFEGLNIHFDAKLLGIGREIGNDEDKVQIAGDLSVDTVDIHNTSMQLILNPLYNTDGDVRRSRNAHIYIVTRETVRLPQKPILGQRIEIFNDSDSYIEVTHDNVGTMFKIPGFCKITGIAANKGFKFDTEPIYTKQYDI